MKLAVYAGTFDPITLGHYDLIKRAAKMFDNLIVAVSENVGKTPLFTAQERVEMIREAVADLDNVTIDINNRLTVEYAKEKGACALVRGVRAFADFEYELQMAIINRQLDESIETIFLMPKNEYSFINSSLIKGVAKFNGDIGNYVPKNVEIMLKKKYLL